MSQESEQHDKVARAETIIIEVVDELIEGNPSHIHMLGGLGRARDGIGRICTELRGYIEFASQTQPGDYGRQESIDLRVSEDRPHLQI